MRERFHEGISVIELLIVIALIVMLTGAMFLSTLKTSGTAEAAVIVENLRAISEGAKLWYADNRDKVKKMYADKGNIQHRQEYIKEIKKYIIG